MPASPDDAQSVAVEPLPHNSRNEVTAEVVRLRRADGTWSVRKRLAAPDPSYDGPERHRAETDPRSYRWWRREALVYDDPDLRASLAGTGLDLAGGRVECDDRSATLLLEDVTGRTGAGLTFDDYVALARGLGGWQAQGSWPHDHPWASRGFLHDYAALRDRELGPPLPPDEADRAWAHPLVAAWPADLRVRWDGLRGDGPWLHEVMTRLPRTRCHLDCWAANVVRRPTGEVVLLDWAFAGDGAVGEDLGNAVADAALDLSWPGDRVRELDRATFPAYLEGLRDHGCTVDPRLVRLGVAASAVKYTWLLPMVLRGLDRPQRAYFAEVDAEALLLARQQVCALLLDWYDQARDLAADLGLTS